MRNSGVPRAWDMAERREIKLVDHIAEEVESNEGDEICPYVAEGG